MYFNDYKFKDNKILKDELKNSEIFIHDEEAKTRLNTLIDKDTFSKLLGTLCDTSEYIHIDNIKNTPKKFDITITDQNNKKVIIELPYDNTKNKYKIIEENLIREYKIIPNKEDINIDLNSIEFINKNNSVKKNLTFTNGNLILKINNYLGILNLESKEDIYSDEEKIKDLVLNYQDTPTTEELFFDIKNTMQKKYDSIELLYKKTLTDFNTNPDEILVENDNIKKFLVTRNDKQFDLTNQLDKLNIKYK